MNLRRLRQIILINPKNQPKLQPPIQEASLNLLACEKGAERLPLARLPKKLLKQKDLLNKNSNSKKKPKMNKRKHPKEAKLKENDRAEEEDKRTFHEKTLIPPLPKPK